MVSSIWLERQRYGWPQRAGRTRRESLKAACVLMRCYCEAGWAAPFPEQNRALYQAMSYFQRQCQPTERHPQPEKSTARSATIPRVGDPYPSETVSGSRKMVCVPRTTKLEHQCLHSWCPHRVHRPSKDQARKHLTVSRTPSRLETRILSDMFATSGRVATGNLSSVLGS
jgi:hypothetical protein